MNLEQAIFDLGAHIRYVAFGNGQTISTKQRDGVSAASAEGTDFYEELLVNPTLLRLATQRGELDCGGLRFSIVGYGNFNQVVAPASPAAHVSVCVERDADAQTVAHQVTALLAEHATNSVFAK